MKGSQNSLSLSPRWTLHVTRPFNLYKEGAGLPKEGRAREQSLGLDTKSRLNGDSLISIMRPSHKQHVGLLPDDVSRGTKLSKPLSVLRLLIPLNPSQATT